MLLGSIKSHRTQPALGPSHNCILNLTSQCFVILLQLSGQQPEDSTGLVLVYMLRALNTL